MTIEGTHWELKCRQYALALDLISTALESVPASVLRKYAQWVLKQTDPTVNVHGNAGFAPRCSRKSGPCCGGSQPDDRDEEGHAV